MLRITGMEMTVKAIKTPIYDSKTNLLDFILENITEPLEESVLVITSKIVSLYENQVVSSSHISKKELVKREADHYIGEIGYDVHLTVKHGILIPSAGIDESNSPNGDFILYPQNPSFSVQQIQKKIKERLGLKHFGVILSDSHTTPLRRGVTGICLAHSGFQAIESKIGATDLFDRELKYTTMNWADALAAAATILMGESNESRPLAIIRCKAIVFNSAADKESLAIPLEEDLYYPLLKDKL